MAEDKSKAEQLVEQLKAEGWKEQCCGSIYISRTLSSSLMKDGEIITIQQEFCPEEKVLKDLWPEG